MSTSLLLVGVVLHLLLAFSIFEIYYSSPVIFGLPAHEITLGEAAAKRVVFISADGLRQDTFLKNPDKSPFLHALIRSRKGVWGTSISHVPTESRPGHVALFAGFSEDVSAVAKGWKKNPVPFDSIFNRSKEAWLLGSPDIVSLFPSSHVHIESYAEGDEDFGSDEAYKLDEWVFLKFEELLKRSESDAYLKTSLEGDRRVFFLHLLGLDTNGHGNKPYSKQYVDNIAVVDSGVSRIARLTSRFFGDDRTAFIFTADHGMTDWGSHGAGSDEEVLTPFVAWGAGIREGGQKVTLAQVDVAPLVSSLLGIPIPVNSVGILPANVLNVPEKYLFQSAYSNFLQLREQLTHLRNEKAHRLWFSDYEKFGEKALSALQDQLRALGKSRRFVAGASMWTQHANLVRDAIFYYHRYDRGFLGACISASFILWIALVLCHVVGAKNSEVFSPANILPSKIFLSLLICSVMFCVYCRFSPTCWLYVLLPVCLLSVLFNFASSNGLLLAVRHIIADYETGITIMAKVLIFVIAGVLLLAPLVLTFLDRRMLSAVFVILQATPFFYATQGMGKWKIAWHLICAGLCVFPFLSTVGQDCYPSLCIISPLLIGATVRWLSEHPSLHGRRFHLQLLSNAHFGASAVVFITEYIFDKTPTVIRLICWCTLPLAFLLPIIFSPLKIADRLISFAGFLLVPYCLLSIAYESFFTLFFVGLLIILMRFEFAHLTCREILSVKIVAQLSNGVAGSSTATMRDAARAALAVCLVIGALFGTGNFASLNSFNPSTLHRFISVFSPFTMAALLVTKLLVPLLILTMTFASVLVFDKEAIGRLSYFALTITDLMALCLFHQLRDTGSWLDIGLSISAFIVSMCLSLSLLLLLICSSWLLTLSPASLPVPLSRNASPKEKVIFDETA